MGFTEYERSSFVDTLRPQNEMEALREKYLSDDVNEFLRSEGLHRQVRDYAIMSRIGLGN